MPDLETKLSQLVTKDDINGLATKNDIALLLVEMRSIGKQVLAAMDENTRNLASNLNTQFKAEPLKARVKVTPRKKQRFESTDA